MTKSAIGLEGTGSAFAEPPSHRTAAHAVEVRDRSGDRRGQGRALCDGRPISARVLNPMNRQRPAAWWRRAGIGQALYEHAVTTDTRRLVTGSFMDYAMPRADMLPHFEIALERCRPTNPIGVKGIGESGTIGAPPVVINAIIDGSHRSASTASTCRRRP